LIKGLTEKDSPSRPARKRDERRMRIRPQREGGSGPAILIEVRDWLSGGRGFSNGKKKRKRTEDNTLPQGGRKRECRQRLSKAESLRQTGVVQKGGRRGMKWGKREKSAFSASKKGKIPNLLSGGIVSKPEKQREKKARIS